MKTTPLSILSALLLAALPGLAMAQTPAPAKPAAKTTVKAPAKSAAAPVAAPVAAAGDKTLSIGGKSGSGPILTRDELRACLSQEEVIRKRLEAHTLLRAPLDKEKADLAAAQQSLRADRAPLEDMKKQAEALSERMKAYAARVTAWNDSVTAFNANTPTGAKGDRDRNALNKEREDLGVQQKVLETEKTEFSAKSEAIVRDYNAKAAAVDAQVTGWNKRNEQWNQDARALEADRSEWVISCADRRYREDDETAIKNGK
jgi:predicted  nucleic acid-binding Zn-ribbon protein